MKALVYEGAKKAVLEEVEEPKKREGTVKLDIKYCGICGSDIGIYLGTHPRAKAPLVFGHEFLGIVAEDGQKFKKGEGSTVSAAILRTMQSLQDRERACMQYPGTDRH